MDFLLPEALSEVVLAGDFLYVFYRRPVSGLAVYDFQADRGIGVFG